MSFVSRAMSIATLVLILGSPQVSPASNGGDPLPGLWQGAILVRPAELEVGLTLELQRSGGDLQGRISFPTQSADVHELAQIDAQGSTVQWIYKDPSGDPSFFNGVLSDDRQELSGTVQDGGKTLRFALRRAKQIAAPPRVMRLSPDGMELRSLFDRDAADVRVLMILSPSCTYCRSSARIVQSYLLNHIEDPNLKVYVVWERVNPEDSEALARQFAALMHDGRATHFWSDHRYTGNAFHDAVGPTRVPPWDLVLVFRAGERWTGRAPTFDSLMYNQKTGDRNYLSVNGLRLAEKVSDLLRARQVK